jgi:hypothetical protein
MNTIYRDKLPARPDPPPLTGLDVWVMIVVAAAVSTALTILGWLAFSS